MTIYTRVGMEELTMIKKTSLEAVNSCLKIKTNILNLKSLSKRFIGTLDDTNSYIQEINQQIINLKLVLPEISEGKQEAKKLVIEQTQTTKRKSHHEELQEIKKKLAELKI